MANIKELVQQEETLLAEHAELAARTKDTYESDTVLSDEESAKYEATVKRGLMLGSQLNVLRGQIERAERREQSRRPVKEHSALSRALHQIMEGKPAANGLEDWEAKKFLPQELDPSANYPVDPSKTMLHFKLGPDETSQSPFQGFEAVIPASDTDAGKGVVPKPVEQRIIHDRLIFGKVGSTMRRITTADGNPRGSIYRNATARGNIRNAQGQAIAANDPADFKNVVMGSLDTDSGEMKLQRQFITDVMFDADAEIRMEGLNRIARSWNQAITKNQGGPLANEMPGLIGMANKTTAVGKNAVTYDNFVDCREDLADYLDETEGVEGLFPMDTGMGQVTWQADTSAIKLLHKLKDGNQRPLLQMADAATLSRGFPALVLGIPLMRNNDMDSFAAGAATGSVPVLLVNGAYFAYRLVNNPEVFVFWDSRTAISNGMQVSYLVYHRRHFVATGAITAGNGVNDATKSNAISAMATA